jgi:hypothetical protein
VLANEDWQRAVDELEVELLSCAAQVLDCIERQGVRERGEDARIEAGLPGLGEEGRRKIVSASKSQARAVSGLETPRSRLIAETKIG